MEAVQGKAPQSRGRIKSSPSPTQENSPRGSGYQATWTGPHADAQGFAVEFQDERSESVAKTNKRASPAEPGASTPTSSGKAGSSAAEGCRLQSFGQGRTLTPPALFDTAAPPQERRNPHASKHVDASSEPAPLVRRTSKGQAAARSRRKAPAFDASSAALQPCLGTLRSRDVSRCAATDYGMLAAVMTLREGRMQRRRGPQSKPPQRVLVTGPAQLEELPPAVKMQVTVERPSSSRAPRRETLMTDPMTAVDSAVAQILTLDAPDIESNESNEDYSTNAERGAEAGCSLSDAAHGSSQHAEEMGNVKQESSTHSCGPADKESPTFYERPAILCHIAKLQAAFRGHLERRRLHEMLHSHPPLTCVVKVQEYSRDAGEPSSLMDLPELSLERLWHIILQAQGTSTLGLGEFLDLLEHCKSTGLNEDLTRATRSPELLALSPGEVAHIAEHMLAFPSEDLSELQALEILEPVRVPYQQEYLEGKPAPCRQAAIDLTTFKRLAPLVATLMNVDRRYLWNQLAWVITDHFEMTTDMAMCILWQGTPENPGRVDDPNILLEPFTLAKFINMCSRCGVLDVQARAGVSESNMRTCFTNVVNDMPVLYSQQARALGAQLPPRDGDLNLVRGGDAIRGKTELSILLAALYRILPGSNSWRSPLHMCATMLLRAKRHAHNM